MPNLWNGTARISTFDGRRESSVMAIPMAAQIEVTRLADGRWLVASYWPSDGGQNARLFTANGKLDREFGIGPYFSQLQASPDGTFWVGYEDQGVFTNQGPDGNWPPSTSGIAQFSSEGKLLWGWNDDEESPYPVDDCYALTLDGNVMWSVPYSDFPIVSFDGVATHRWSNHITFPSALAVDNTHVVLAGGFEAEAGRIALLELGDGAARSIGELAFTPLTRRGAELLQGQGASLHIVANGVWCQLTVKSVRDALQSCSSTRNA